mmetsp:Transcript_45777/g.74686  ORF Transcript_45777/g.74686 Transcript_45777/m.74686 type:complete len:287 (-) Transcript_45777:56-916(-)|eukprot:CAMPEP_0184650400 /NCGR_PEP_ID=MMETSP0308-20130426/7921_1 /TAXON_ID=38269 /ORGANISM="Gloeochaete witrockiana, Strain SAG 46.84" /LENGTH=286 /DNA_ID=CAMNT_0027083891 /DNA_START=228 /DNA_END=1088 /DNA_ORIENTATION=-
MGGGASKKRAEAASVTLSSATETNGLKGKRSPQQSVKDKDDRRSSNGKEATDSSVTGAQVDDQNGKSELKTRGRSVTIDPHVLDKIIAEDLAVGDSSEPNTVGQNTAQQPPNRRQILSSASFKSVASNRSFKSIASEAGVTSHQYVSDNEEEGGGGGGGGDGEGPITQGKPTTEVDEVPHGAVTGQVTTLRSPGAGSARSSISEGMCSAKMYQRIMSWMKDAHAVGAEVVTFAENVIWETNRFAIDEDDSDEHVRHNKVQERSSSRSQSHHRTEASSQSRRAQAAA